MQRNILKNPSLIFCCLVLLAYLPTAQADSDSDSFDELDKMLEAQFQDLDASLEQQYQMLDEALDASYKQLAVDVGSRWGKDEVELPSKTQWVDYTADKTLRRKVDFDKGVIQIEQLIEPDTNIDLVVADMQEAAGEISTDTMADLSKKDTALNDARARLAAEQVELTPFKTSDKRPIIGSVGAEMPDAPAISKLVRQAVATANVSPNESSPPMQEAPGVSAKLSTLQNKKRKITLEVPFKPGYKTTLASRYRTAILYEARRQAIPPSLVFAVMETESSFNPRARSAVPAFGLMQLVPRSGAMDAYEHVYGEKLLLDPEYLFDADQNVELGAAYLNLLYTRYLRKVKDPLSREYCVIAAYNTGAGNVARSFTGETNVTRAAKLINQLTPEEVYTHLIEKLPYEETRHYLQKVSAAKKKYLPMDKLDLSLQLKDESEESWKRDTKLEEVI